MNDPSVCTVSGVVGGTLSSFFASLQTQSLVETVVLSVIGAVVSFAVSAGLEWLRKKIRS
jgi:uncharacterized membrane protein YeaQ/YmgE (transglycosylase-associated protein family)